MPETPNNSGVRILKVQTSKALRERNGTTALEALLVRMFNLGFVATASIPIRTKPLGNTGQTVTESFLLVLTQIGGDIDADTLADIGDQQAQENQNKQDSQENDSNGIEDISSNTAAAVVAEPEVIPKDTSESDS